MIFKESRRACPGLGRQLEREQASARGEGWPTIRMLLQVSESLGPSLLVPGPPSALGGWSRCTFQEPRPLSLRPPEELSPYGSPVVRQYVQASWALPCCSADHNLRTAFVKQVFNAYPHSRHRARRRGTHVCGSQNRPGGSEPCPFT